MKNNFLISIIIPIYNSEKFLKKLFIDIDNQKYKNYEVLLIDDGSTDSSHIICKSKANGNAKYKYFKKNNTGVSDTRNYGIKKSNGDYICFIDSDDKIDCDYLYDFVQCINEFGDNIMSCCNMQKFKDETNIKNQNINFSPYRYKSNKYTILFSNYAGYIWNKIYKRSILIENNIFFDKRISMCEDMIFNYKYMKYVNEIICYDKKNYFYRITNSSISKSLSNSKWFTIYNSYDILFDNVFDNSINNEFLKQLNYSYIVNLYQGKYRLKFIKADKNFISIKKDLHNRIDKINFSKYNFSKKMIIKILFYKYFNFFSFKMKFKKEFEL